MENPSYYAIIPADVRYSKIKANAKLLYGEITALANKTGECYASNGYFAELYGVSEKQVSLWIKELVDNGFCTSRVEQDNGNKRFIAIHQKVKTYTPKGVDPYTPKGVHNNTSSNNKKNTKVKKVFETTESYYNDITEGGYIDKAMPGVDHNRIKERIDDMLLIIKTKGYKLPEIPKTHFKEWNKNKETGELIYKKSKPKKTEPDREYERTRPIGVPID